jgi:hypothetical protein
VARLALDDRPLQRSLSLTGTLHLVQRTPDSSEVSHKWDQRHTVRTFGGVRIEYYHIELDTHEVLYERALVDRREHFSNFVECERLYGGRQPEKLRGF